MITVKEGMKAKNIDENDLVANVISTKSTEFDNT